MKNHVFPILLLGIVLSVRVYSQPEEVLYPFLFELMNANQRVSYVAIGKENCQESSRVKPLTPEEGGEGYVAEALLDFTFPVLQKRVLKKVKIDADKENQKDSQIRPFFGYSRIVLNYGFHTKIINTESSPILPPTNRFGIQLDKIICFHRSETDSATSMWQGVKNAFQFKRMDAHRFRSNEGLFMLNFSLLLNHYSNGQDGDEMLAGDNRNNYMNGNFSTNHISPKLNATWLTKTNWLYFLSLGYQREFGDTTSFLSFPTAQADRRYGLNRLLVQCQVRGDIFKGRKNTGFSKFMNQFESRLRLEVEQILDRDLANFPYSQKYRAGVHTYLEINHVYVRSMGFLVHCYWGRDPLNIRYDDPIWYVKFGVAFEINKYTSRRDDQ